MLEAEVEGDETAERGASEAGVFGGGEGAIGVVDEGFHFVEEESAVGLAFTATQPEVACWGVLGHAAEAGVGDADEDDGFDLVVGEEAVGGGVGLPGASGDVGEAAVEEVLAVMQVEDWKAAGGVFVVGGGEVDGDGSFRGQGEDG